MLPPIPWNEAGVRFLLSMDKTRGNSLELDQGRFIEENSWKGLSHPERWWNCCPGIIPKRAWMWHIGTPFRVTRLDSMIPKVFFNLSLSMERGEKMENEKGNGKGGGGGLGDKMKRGVRVGREMRDELGVGK